MLTCVCYRIPVLRASELLLIAYFIYTSLLAAVLPISAGIRRTTLLLNVAIIAVYILLAYADTIRRRQLLGVMRDWFPVTLMLLCYRQMGWFAQAHSSFDLENSWVVWDRMILNAWGGRAAIEASGAIIPSLLEISYSLVYAIAPFSMAMLYVYRKRERVNLFLFTFLIGILLSYSLFPYFPSEPPRTVFPGEDFPTVNTIFRRFNWYLLGGYGIHTSVFPSAHVSGAFAASFGMKLALPEQKWIGRLLLVLATLIAIATVYGRYHYAVDAVAGLVVSFTAWAVAWRLRKRLVAPLRPVEAQASRV
jgi:membrane-associated phospholipid phosphatase